MQSPISECTSKCIEMFQQLQSLKHTASPADLERDAGLVDCAFRFRLWAGNLGAFHPITDGKSADYRLRSAPTIRKHLVEVLGELVDTLLDIEAIIAGNRIDESLIQPYDSSQDSEEDIVGGGTSELQELCASVPEIITSLFKVSILIRQSTKRDRYAKAAAASYDQFLPDFDIQHVGDKFPKVLDERWLQERLGHAITTRRQYLRYTRDHHDKIALAPAILIDVEVHGTQQAATVGPSHPSENTRSGPQTLAQTTASTLEEPVTVSSPIYDLDDEAQDDRSEATSFVSSMETDGETGELRVVRLQELQKNGEEFECPYCRGIVKARRQRAWKKHVFRDLRSYVCTFPDCNVGLFEYEQTWIRHELEYHRRQWVCPVCPNESFDSPDMLRRHLESRHDYDKSLHSTMDSVIQSCSRPVTEIAASACPLCDEWDHLLRIEARSAGQIIPHTSTVMVPVGQFKRHLGAHQEQLALFAITPNWQRGMESEDGSQDEDSMNTGRRSAPEGSDNLTYVWSPEDIATIERLCILFPDRRFVETTYLAQGKIEHQAASVLLQAKAAHYAAQTQSRKYMIQPAAFFVFGKIFKTSSRDYDVGTAETEISEAGAQGLESFSDTRLFVVISKGQDFCRVLPIGTKTRKWGNLEAEYCVVHSGDEVPQPTTLEQGMRFKQPAIRVILDDTSEVLDVRSRIQLWDLKFYWSEMTVRSIGMVAPESLSALMEAKNHRYPRVKDENISEREAASWSDAANMFDESDGYADDDEDEDEDEDDLHSTASDALEQLETEVSNSTDGIAHKREPNRTPSRKRDGLASQGLQPASIDPVPTAPKPERTFLRTLEAHPRLLARRADVPSSTSRPWPLSTASAGHADAWSEWSDESSSPLVDAKDGSDAKDRIRSDRLRAKRSETP